MYGNCCELPMVVTLFIVDEYNLVFTVTDDEHWSVELAAELTEGWEDDDDDPTGQGVMEARIVTFVPGGRPSN